jgi:sterol desaturase/sphingolipid hydroxylase (fatty acid hydroxylase superfamily)
VLHWLSLPAATGLVPGLLLFDAWMYGWHWLNHRVRFLWRFHRTHHSDPWMDVTTAHRFHLGEILFSACLRVPVLALLGLSLGQLAVYETLQCLVVQWHHANIGLPAQLDRWLRVWVVTPAMHKVHHSRRPAETNSNYSSLLSIWDRLFRTFRLGSEPRSIRFGLEDFDEPGRQSLAGLFMTPLDRPATSSLAPNTGRDDSSS